MTDSRAALVEKVARAICKADGTEPDSLDPWMGEHQHPAWEDYEEQATAAIDIIRAEVLEDAAEIERLRKMLWEVNEQCPEHVPVSLLNQIRAALKGK
jgi:hypothetical protein